MQISFNWLKQFINLDYTSQEVAEILTDIGLEVEGVENFESVKGSLKGIVVGEIRSCEKHPAADRLSLTKVDLGNNNIVQIVCGASNVAAGQKVPVATIGTKLFDKDGNTFEIKKGKIRGEESHGMICAEDEIGLGDNHDGILVLDKNLISGTPLSEVIKVEVDEVFEIGLTPNRADAMSHFGVARDLRAAISLKKSVPELIMPSTTKYKLEKRTLKVDVVVEDAKLVPRYCGVTLSGVKVKESPLWLQNKLKAIGINPKNNIVDATNYVLHELGQPLHAFDISAISGNKIIVKNSLPNTKFITLDGVERTLTEDDIVICNDNEPMCIAGVMGGKNSGVTASTQNIFLESAYFNSISIRKTAKRLGISSDSSFRFERGIDPNITEYALKRAVLLIQEIAGGEVTSDIIDIYPKKVEDFQVFLHFSKLDKVLGESINKDVVKKILTSLDIKINSFTEVGIGLSIPPYRVDVQREIDVIEEILRIYGYNTIKIPEKVNASMSNSSRFAEYKIQNNIAHQLLGLGFNEIMCNSLTSSQLNNIDNVLKESQEVKMLNPLSADLSVLRQSMLYSGLEAIRYNINRKNSNLKFFEFGKTYHKLLSGYEERKYLTLFLTGNINAEHWVNNQEKSSFFWCKGYVETILERLGLKDKLQPNAVQLSIFSEGMNFTIANEEIVRFGKINSQLLALYDIKQDVFYAEFDFNLLQKYVATKIKFEEIAKYPEVRRDLALLVDKDIAFNKVYNIVNAIDKKILKEVSLFDVYEGEKLPEGKKSYAISMILQDKSKTLTDTQIEKFVKLAQDKLQEEVGATVR